MMATSKKLWGLRQSSEGGEQLGQKEVPHSNTKEVGWDELGSWKISSGQRTVILRQEATEIVVGLSGLYGQTY